MGRILVIVPAFLVQPGGGVGGVFHVFAFPFNGVQAASVEDEVEGRLFAVFAERFEGGSFAYFAWVYLPELFEPVIVR